MLTAQTVNTYLAVLLITICGSVAALAIINVAQETSFLSYDTTDPLTKLDQKNF